MVKRRRVPIRTCVTCGLKAAKRDLLRIVASPDGSIAVDAVGKLNGRGAYLCVECRRVPETLRRGRLEHSLKTGISDDEWGSVLKELAITTETGRAEMNA